MRDYGSILVFFSKSDTVFPLACHQSNITVMRDCATWRNIAKVGVQFDKWGQLRDDTKVIMKRFRLGILINKSNTHKEARHSQLKQHSIRITVHVYLNREITL